MSGPDACWKSATMPRSTAARPELASTGGRITFVVPQSSHGFGEIAEATRQRNRSEVHRARAGMAGERAAVHGDQPERGRVPERPLEVVEQRPVEVAADVHALRHALEDLAHRLVDVSDSLVVVAGGDPVLRHEDRHARARAVHATD